MKETDSHQLAGWGIQKQKNQPAKKLNLNRIFGASYLFLLF
jgi:hypothetical protein